MKRFNSKWSSVILSAVVVGIAALLIACSTTSRVMVVPPMIPGAEYVGSETCALCHEKEVKDFKRTAHARITIPGEDNRLQGQGCESCHGPGSLHVAAEGKNSKHNIINPQKNPEGCFQCHIDKSAEFSLPYRHPVKEGKMSCTDCHDPHGDEIHKGKKMSVARVNETCNQCHREQARAHVFEHEALREGCTTCHKVHGSINDKMLVERDQNLCLKCHAQTPGPGQAARSIYIGKTNHTNFLTQGTCWSAGCHTAMHGSNVNPHLRY
jgi:predicted CXXCH cytochrome family protein